MGNLFINVLAIKKIPLVRIIFNNEKLVLGGIDFDNLKKAITLLKLYKKEGKASQELINIFFPGLKKEEVQEIVNNQLSKSEVLNSDSLIALFNNNTFDYSVYSKLAYIKVGKIAIIDNQIKSLFKLNVRKNINSFVIDYDLYEEFLREIIKDEYLNNALNKVCKEQGIVYSESRGLVLYFTIKSMLKRLNTYYIHIYIYDTHSIDKRNRSDIIYFLSTVLLRIGGLESYDEDKFEKIGKYLDSLQGKPISKSYYDTIKQYLEDEEIITFIWNIIKINVGEQPETLIGRRLKISNPNDYMAIFLDYVKKSNAPKKVKDIIKYVYSYKNNSTRCIKSLIYLGSIVSGCSQLREKLMENKLIKLPQYTTMELVGDKSLEGLIFHFDNDTTAYYYRKQDHTEICNLGFGAPLTFNVGLIDSLKNERRYNNKPLYATGVKGRYNPYGYRAPLKCENVQNIDLYQKFSNQFSTDSQISAICLYSMVSCTYAIEFIIITRIDFNEKFLKFSNGIEIFQCDKENLDDAEYIYDCTISFDKLTEDEIVDKINVIENFIASLSFTYNVDVKYIFKYYGIDARPGTIIGVASDVEKFKIDDVDDGLLTSIDWFILGNKSNHIFNKYLSYAISIETLAQFIYDNKGKIGNQLFNVNIESQNDKIQRLNTLKNNLFKNESDIEKDIEALYVAKQSLGYKLKEVFKCIFGESSKEYKAMFIKSESNSLSLYNIRHKLAHGTFSRRQKESNLLINSRVHQIEGIAKKFILRVMGQENFVSTYSMKMTLQFNNPRTASIVSGFQFIGGLKDWKIKRDWLLDLL